MLIKVIFYSEINAYSNFMKIIIMIYSSEKMFFVILILSFEEINANLNIAIVDSSNDSSILLNKFVSDKYWLQVNYLQIFIFCVQILSSKASFFI